MLHNWYWNNDKFNASDCLAIIESESMLPPKRTELKEVIKNIEDNEGRIHKVKYHEEHEVNEWEKE